MRVKAALRKPKARPSPKKVRLAEVIPLFNPTVNGHTARDSAAARFQVLFDYASDAMLVVDLKSTRITSVNKAMVELTGYLRDEIENYPMEMLVPKIERDGNGNHNQEMGKPMSLEHFRSSGFFEDLVLLRKDGYFRYVSLSVKVLKLQGKATAIGILRDVAEKKNMERELITKHNELRSAYVELERANTDLHAAQETLVQAGKLAALGELAAGIAHELNQPLTAIKGFGQEALALATRDSKIAEYLKEVVTAADKMEKIISHLRGFTRKSTEDFEWVDVRAVIGESLKMLARQLDSRGIKVEQSFAANLPNVYCNPFQLEQVFINLATNARDAIEMAKRGSGLLKISARAVDAGMLEIRFEDNGVGMQEKVKSKIFNPFFTTKEVGQGMGLGLSISYGILSKLSASIVVESEAGKGTVFVIKLPVDYRKH